MSQPANGDSIARLLRQQLRAPIKPWHPPLALPGSRPQQKRKRLRSASPVMQHKDFVSFDAYVDPVIGHPQEYFVKVLGTKHHENPRFAYNRSTTTVRLENMDACCMPETLVLRTFGTALREACAAVGGNVSRISVSIESSALRYPIGVPFRPLHQNTPHALLCLFLKYEQSETIASLLGASFDVAVSTIQARRGAGRPKAEVKHNVNDSCLIEVTASRLYATVGKPGGMKKDDFSRMIQRISQPPKTSGTKRGRPQKTSILKDHSIEEHLPLVQQYYNQRWPGLYRIAAFTEVRVYKPVFKGETAQYDVCVTRSVTDAGNLHFDGIRNLARIFGKDNYCLDCEKPYYRKQKHTTDCVRRCSNCARMGPDFPCLPNDPPFFKKSTDCGKSFSNKSCFEVHLTSGMCRLYQRCSDCGAVYNTDCLKQLSPEWHKCDYKFCQFCFGYHKRDQECFVQPLKPASDDKDVRFVAFDFESTQGLQTSPGKFQHRDLPTAKSAALSASAAAIPRLELMATVLGTRLVEFMQKQLTTKIPKATLRNDSQVVYFWIKSQERQPVFVENRLKEIRALIDLHDINLRHVPTELNPADVLSRGIRADQLQDHGLWWHGPPFLKEPDVTRWPPQPEVTEYEETDQSLEQMVEREIVMSPLLANERWTTSRIQQSSTTGASCSTRPVLASFELSRCYDPSP